MILTSGVKPVMDSTSSPVRASSCAAYAMTNSVTFWFPLTVFEFSALRVYILSVVSPPQRQTVDVLCSNSARGRVKSPKGASGLH